MTMKQLYIPKNRDMRVAAFMSGSGSNVRKLIEESRARDTGYQIALIVTDKPVGSKANEIGREYGIQTYGIPFLAWHKARELDPKEDTTAYYREIGSLLHASSIDGVALGGYMRMVPGSFLDEFPLTVNVHPADLSQRGMSGRPLYSGDHAMELVMAAGETFMRASTILVDRGEDTGPILVRSAPLQIDYNASEEANQTALKRNGDHVIFPKTLEWIAQGRFSIDDEKRVYFDKRFVPNGIDMELHK